MSDKEVNFFLSPFSNSKSHAEVHLQTLETVFLMIYQNNNVSMIVKTKCVFFYNMLCFWFSSQSINQLRLFHLYTNKELSNTSSMKSIITLLIIKIHYFVDYFSKNCFFYLVDVCDRNDRLKLSLTWKY